MTPVFDLPVWRASAWIFNCYALACGDDVLLFDPGLPSVATQALRGLRALGRDPADVKAVVCTHGHSDHVAGAPTITSACRCEAWLPARCERYLDGEPPRTFPLVESSVRFMPVYGEQPFSWQALREFVSTSRTDGFGGREDFLFNAPIGGFLDDGAAVPYAEGWTALAVPGHTDCSTAFYHADSETLISGDAVVTHDGCPWFNPEHVDRQHAAAAEARLRALPVRHLLPGHGLPVSAPDVWAAARSWSEPPTGRGWLSRCARRFGRWG